MEAKCGHAECGEALEAEIRRVALRTWSMLESSREVEDICLVAERAEDARVEQLASEQENDR